MQNKEHKEQGYIILQKGNKKEKHTIEGFCGSLYLNGYPNKIEMPTYPLFDLIFRRKKVMREINGALENQTTAYARRFHNLLFSKIFEMFLNKSFGEFKGIITSRSEQHINISKVGDKKNANEPASRRK